MSQVLSVGNMLGWHPLKACTLPCAGCWLVERSAWTQEDKVQEKARKTFNIQKALMRSTDSGFSWVFLLTCFASLQRRSLSIMTSVFLFIRGRIKDQHCEHEWPTLLFFHTFFDTNSLWRYTAVTCGCESATYLPRHYHGWYFYVWVIAQCYCVVRSGLSPKSGAPLCSNINSSNSTKQPPDAFYI